MNKAERVQRQRKIMSADLTTVRFKKELNLDFMVAYIRAKKPEILEKFLTIYAENEKSGRDFFCLECAEIVKVAEKKLSKKEKALEMLRELQSQTAEVKPIKVAKAV